MTTVDQLQETEHSHHPLLRVSDLGFFFLHPILYLGLVSVRGLLGFYLHLSQSLRATDIPAILGKC